jgi:hypothetical protein
MSGRREVADASETKEKGEFVTSVLEARCEPGASLCCSQRQPAHTCATLAQMPISGYTDLASSTVHTSLASVQNSTLRSSPSARTPCRRQSHRRSTALTTVRMHVQAATEMNHGSHLMEMVPHSSAVPKKRLKVQFSKTRTRPSSDGIPLAIADKPVGCSTWWIGYTATKQT